MPSPSPLPVPKRRSLRSRAAFTIVEVAVAATVLVFAISSAIIVLQSGFKALDNARKTTLAAQIIQSEMERIRMLSWSRVEDLQAATPQIELSSIFPQNTELERQVLAQMTNTFTATRTVTPLAAYSNEIMEITVTVTWRGIDGVIHNRSTSTRYCENGLYTYYYTLAS
jgi:type II secretory pathway pseudopilin PulG